MHSFRHSPWVLSQPPQEIRSPFYRLLRIWGNRKSPTIRNEIPLTLSYHHKEPSPQFIVHWWKSALSSKLSRRSIEHLITFRATNEDVIKSQNTTPSHTLA
ncbi:hypothetical protein AVEN_56562-1 [Araneus ventricosus]|uniref:Uncharacterized protein n=1 Tax=Araneus ventricosus TaxID=182803 RepID=A0A4Y2HH56_ARAVE|nr:hypothetical protein AVEN_56562-1 [Araneus ventricosus]